MKKYLLILFLLFSVNGFAQKTSPYFKMLPTDVSATYAVFHAAVLTDSVGPYGFFYWIDPNHQIWGPKYYYDINSDSLITSDTVFNLQCNQKYFVMLMGFEPGQFGGAVGAVDSFYTLDTIGCTTHVDGLGINAKPSFSIYPMPVTERSTISLTGATEAVIDMYDLTGKLCNQINVEHGKGIINRNEFITGVYWYRTIIDDKVYTGKLIIQ